MYQARQGVQKDRQAYQEEENRRELGFGSYNRFGDFETVSGMLGNYYE
jgi:hypothetical protein